MDANTASAWRKDPGPTVTAHMYGLTFFLLLSSCVTFTDGDLPADSSSRLMADTPGPAHPAPHIQSPGGLDDIPGAASSPPADLVANLPPVPAYAEGRAAASVDREPPGLPRTLVDDMDPASLKQAIHNQLAAMWEQDPDRQVPLGHRTVSVGRLQRTLIALEALLDRGLSPEQFSREVREKFHIYPAGRRRDHTTLLTGYYTPVIPASRVRTPKFTLPLYRKPHPYQMHLYGYDQARRTNGDYGFHLVATSNFSPLTRRDIDGGKALQEKNLEVAWLADDLDRYFLHIQGSGYLQFEDGTRQAVQYMGSNEMAYRSVGQLMIDEGVITTRDGSMQGIKRYFKNHPQDIPKYLHQNPRYIFFNLSHRQPVGSGGAELIAGRSIATDKRIYPAGGLVFLQARKPILNQRDEIVGWKPFSRFVLDQDTGAAIRGEGRGDLYFGVGHRAGVAAGHYMERGKIFYLVLK
ncbi:MAG: MltA domain-containing protein [Nitrospinaceae bacterium]